MRDMMATHERLETRSPTSRESVRKVAAAAFEALPALLLAAALLMPALAAIAKSAEQATAEWPANAEIRAEAREAALDGLQLPKL